RSVEQLRLDIAAIKTIIDTFVTKITLPADSEKSMNSQIVVYLLRDAVQSYQLSEGGLNKIDYENAIGIVDVANARYQLISDSLDKRRKAEVDFFFSELKSSVSNRGDNETVVRLATAIERDLAEDLSIISAGKVGHKQYFANIRDLLGKVVTEVKAGDYEQADQLAISAYLDNYEYLEGPIELQDRELMITIEVAMREELRKMIKAQEPASEIETLVQDILANLDTAEELVATAPPGQAAVTSSTGFSEIEGLKAGFGAYTGERKSIGEADDPAKAAVRRNIDEIRFRLDDTLRLYAAGDAEGALVESRKAYLDSYENVEIPLRPIDPDFTLEMEIKFAELRS
ncbi:MAG: hypothetical protein ACREA4_13295, partial [Nitrososphaera sp.]